VIQQQKILREKAAETTKLKEETGKNLSTRNMTKSHHNINTVLLQSATEIRTQGTMKSSRKALHEFSPHIPPKTPKRNINSSMNEMSRTGIAPRAQRTRVSNTHAKEATNYHQNTHYPSNQASQPP
jgi:hypothetical protein